MDNKIFVVAKREYLERVRTRAFIITTLLIPVLMAGVVLVPAYIAAKSKPSGSLRKMRILDATGTGVGTRIVQTIRSDSSVADSVSGPFLVTVSAAQLKAAEDSAVAEVMKPRSLAGYLVLDDSTMSANRARYVGRNATTIADMDRLRNAVRQSVMVERLETSGVNKETIDQVAKSNFQLPTQKLDEKGKGGSGVAGLLAGVIIGIMLLMSIIIHGQNVMRGVLEEKTTRVAEIVISSIKPEALLAGKVLGVGAVGLTQIFAWLLLSGYTTSFFGPIVMKAAGGGATVAAAAGANAPLAGAFGGIPYAVLGASIAFFLVGFVFYATLYAAVGSMVNSEQEAQQAATPVMLLLMSGWIFFNNVLVAPNSTLAVVLSWLPWTSPIMMPIRMGLTSVAPASVAGSLAVCIVGSLAAVWLAARIYRVGMLMYGKKPSFAEVAKWIRYA